MALLEHELAQARFQYNLVLAAILEAAERERQRARSSVGARPVSVKKTSSSGCLRCTGHRPILGRAPADVFSDVVTMGMR